MRKAYLAIICLFTGFNAFAQHTDIQPVPQQISESGQLITLPGSYQFTGDTEANPYAVQQLKQLLAGNHSAKEGLRIYIGEKGDKAIRKFARRIPNQKEGTIFVSTIKKSYWQEMTNEEHSMPCRLSAAC